MLNGGTLSIGSDANLGEAGGALTFGGGLLQVTGTALQNLDAHPVNWDTFNGGFDIAHAANTFTVSSNLTTVAAFTKAGAGTLVLGGTNVFTAGATTVSGGTLTLAASSSNTLGAVSLTGGAAGARLNINGVTTNTVMQIGTQTGDRAVVTINNDLTLSKMYVGVNSGAGAVIQNSGTVTVATAQGGQDVLSLANGAGAYGYYRMNGGVINAGQLAPIGNTASTLANNGVMDINGGALNVTAANGWIVLGWQRGNGEINIYNGSVSNGATGNDTTLGFTASLNSFGMINLLGPGAAMDATAGAGARSVNLAANAGNFAGVLNLNGGVLTANRVYASNAGTPSLLGFNGGTLKAGPATTLGATFISGLSAALIYAGGATIDTTNANVTVAQALLAPTGLGLASIAVTNGGAGYIGAPMVLISGGGGLGATAIAQVDLASGTVTNLLITSPGFGYTSAPTVSLYGGGCTSTAGVDTAALVLNSAAGGLTKIGSGILTLSGANTYGGNTLIQAGTLSILNTGALPGWDTAGRYTVANGAALAVGNAVPDSEITTLLGTGNFAAGAALGFDTAAGARTYAAIVADTPAGPLGLVKIGANTLTLSGANSYSGGTTIGAGTLKLGTFDAITNNGAVTVAGGIYDLGLFGDVTNGPIRMSAGAISNGTLVGESYTFSGGSVPANLAGPGALTNSGGVTFLSGANTYGGNTMIQAGTLTIADTGTLPGWDTFGRFSVAGGAELAVYNAVTDGEIGTLLGTGNFAADARLGFDTTTANREYIPVLTDTAAGALGLVKRGANTLTLSGANSYSGGTVLNAGILVLNNNSALGTGALALTGSAVRVTVNDGMAIANAINIYNNAGASGLGLIQNSGAGNATVNGPITISNSAAAGGHFLSTGGGTLTLNGAITSAVPVTVRNGTVIFGGGGSYSSLVMNQGLVVLGAANGLAANAVFDIGASGAGKFDLAGYDQTLAGLTRLAAQNAFVTNTSTSMSRLTLNVAGTDNYSYAGLMSGPIQLTKLGAGTQTLTGTNNTYSGGTTIGEGVLAAGTASALGTGPVTNNGTLNLTAGAVTYTGLSTSLAGAGVNNVTLGTGTGTTVLNGNYSDFTGIWNIGVGAAAGAGKIQQNGLDNAAATNNVLANATVYVNGAGVTKNATIVLNGGDTGETLGQLRLDSGATWAGSVILAGAITSANDNMVGANSGTGTISGVISEVGGSRALSKGGAGALVLSGSNTYSGMTIVNAGTLLLGDGTVRNGSVAGNISNVTTLIFANPTDQSYAGVISGAGTLTKTGAGILTLGGGSIYSGATLVNNGTLRADAANVFSPNSAITLTNNAGGGYGWLDLNGTSQTIKGLNLTFTNSSPGTLDIADGQTLLVNGAFNMGAVNLGSGVVTRTSVTMTGPGAFVVTNVGGTTLLGNSNGNVKDDHSWTTLDMSGLGAFVLNLGAGGTFRLGSATAETGTASNLTVFATNTTITAGTLRIDLSGASVGKDTVLLGAGTNVINANTINIGTGDLRAHDTLLAFAGSSGVLTINGADGVGAANLSVGIRRASGNITNSVELAGHTAVLNFNQVDIGGVGYNTSGGNTVNGLFSFDTGSLTASTFRVGSLQNATANSRANGTATLGGGVVAIGGGVTLATNFSATATTTVSGTLNITGGTVGIGADASGNAIKMASGVGTNVGLVSITGGAVTLGGDIIKGGGSLGDSATLVLDGGLLDMAGHGIGSGANPIDAFNLQSGTLANVGQFNNGAPLVKTGAGLLILEGAHTYTGGTIVSNGTLQVGSGGTTGSLIGDMANYGTVVFAHSAGATNVMAGNLSGTGTAVLNGGTLILTGTNLYDGATAVSNGTLLVNGSHGGTGMITVYTNATLGGSGELRSMLTVKNGGVLSPGNSPGTLTATTNVTFETGSVFAVELAATNSYDRLQFSGGFLTLNDAFLHVDLSYAAQEGDKFTIVGGAILPQAGQFTLNTANPVEVHPTSGYTNTLLRVDYNVGDNSNDITLTVIPEPETFGLVALFAAAALLRRRRKSREHGARSAE